MSYLFAKSANDSSARLREWTFPIAERLVPPRQRLDWAREWRAELWQMQHERPGRRPAGESSRGALSQSLSLSYGLLADAAWLRADWLRATARGSAVGCLLALSFYCLLCGVTNILLAGSWHSFLHQFSETFLGGFLFVAIPGLFIAAVTYPPRPLRSDVQHEHRGHLSARTRRNMFLGAKVLLTLALGFLSSMIAIVPIRMQIGRYSDWAQLMMWALVVTVGLRWALLNQEQRCQKCLRLLSQPTRVGRPSYNFLHWSGMELACADGHGLLHVPEMRGSWCWYDRWVEQDPVGLSLQI